MLGHLGTWTFLPAEAVDWLEQGIVVKDRLARYCYRMLIVPVPLLGLARIPKPFKFHTVCTSQKGF